ncbi:MAG: double-strand break repair helicase AddA [Blastomonas sp.]
MSGGGSKIFPLVGDQQRAVEPDDNIWLSASAGTGKTQVLTARVFRLLLEQDVKPESILCLTFTKAGASEMANRINSQLAAWVRMDDIALCKDLKHIGAPVDEATRKRARRLFARVLDAPGGGLRIQTIHSFCQTLLAGFPMEAGIMPGFKAMEDRDRMAMARETMAAMLEEAERNGDARLRENLEALSLRMGAEDTESFLLRCAGIPDVMDRLAGDIRPWINDALGLPRGEDGSGLAALCDDAALDLDAIHAAAQANAAWGSKTGIEAHEKLMAFCAASNAGRLDMIAMVLGVFLTAKGEPRKTSAKLLDAEPGYEDMAATIVDQISAIDERRRLIAFSEEFSRALTVGRAFAYDFADAKLRAGVMDFDDLIRSAADLLSDRPMAEWIRYKMDQQFDHILVDESQDTNARQWRIIRGLISDFFAGEGSKPDRMRTLFTVGDFKQAIFGFQGTSPQNYEAARQVIGRDALHGERPLLDLSLNRSFRSTQPVLDVVDRSLELLRPEMLGLEAEIAVEHRGQPGAGHVELWRPVQPGLGDDDGDDGAVLSGDGDGLESWLSSADRIFAQNLAIAIRDWTSGPPDKRLWLHRKGKATSGWARPGDFMILLRRRGDLAPLVVARLHALGVPVAGIDRLRLGQPLAVQDLIAAIRFALQPLDDLNLATLLVSPLVGWTQEELLAHGHRDPGKVLWPHLRRLAKGNAALAVSLEPLYAMLAAADYGTPYQFLESLLTGPIQGKAKLVARLGREALDPIGELLNIAQMFERDHDANLQQFLHWFEQGDEEIKREISEQSDAVRVLTVHGAKGLQAPVVILADACVDPDQARNRGFDWAVDPGLSLPVYALRKEERVGPLRDAADEVSARDLEEHWRLLYVAMTRAEERLYIGGTLNRRQKEAPEKSWHALLDRSLEAMGCDWQEGQAMGSSRIHAEGDCRDTAAPDKSAEPVRDAEHAQLPDWALAPAPVEARPSRPLAPSAPGEDDLPYPPKAAGGDDGAATRGTIMHSLFERLPDVPADRRHAAGMRWLAEQMGIADPDMQQDMLAPVLAVIENPEWAEIFGPDALAEAPVAAVVGEDVVSGTIDRLLVRDDDVLIVDFKTGRNPPESAGAVPMAYLRQMAAYARALAAIYPERTIRAALLYTEIPALIELPPELLAPVKLS